MIRFIKSLPYHFKTAIKSIGRNLAMSLSASSAVMVTLLLMSVFLMLTTNVSSFTKGIEKGIKVKVMIDTVVSESGNFDELKTKIEATPNVEKVVFSSKDQELIDFSDEMGKIWNIYEGEENPMRDAFYIDVKDTDKIDATSEEIAKIEGVEKVNYGGDSISTMIKLFDAVRNGGLIFVIALSLLAIFLIQNTIKMTIYARNKEISIMRNVGATNTFIKMPFMIEGMFIGFFGSLVPIAFTCFGYQFLYKELGGGLFSMFEFEPVYPFIIQLSLILMLSGIVVGIFGSFISVTKYLRWRR